MCSIKGGNMLLIGMLGFFVFAATMKGTDTLSHVELVVDPPTVKKGGYAILKCLRDTEGELMYSVKWYKGNREFYRFIPSETSSVKTFELPGLNIDLALSNDTQVVLRQLDFNMAGNYSCEATADAPTFSTGSDTKYIDVVSLPEYSPVLAPESFEYKPGNTLKANCTGAPSRPAANLTFLINDAIVNPSGFRQFKSDEGLSWNEIAVDLPLNDLHFPYEKLTIRCTAQIYDLYSDGVRMEFLQPFSEPRPERIMSAYSSSATVRPGTSSWFIMMFLLLLLVAVNFGSGKVEDFDDFTNTIYDYPFYEDLTEQIKSSLI